MVENLKKSFIFANFCEKVSKIFFGLKYNFLLFLTRKFKENFVNIFSHWLKISKKSLIFLQLARKASNKPAHRKTHKLQKVQKVNTNLTQTLFFLFLTSLAQHKFNTNLTQTLFFLFLTSLVKHKLNTNLTSVIKLPF